MKLSVRQHAWLIGIIVTFPVTTAQAEEQSLSGECGPVKCENCLPNGKIVRGLSVHLMNHQLKTGIRWAELCREPHCGDVAQVIDRKANNQLNKLATARNACLAGWGEKLVPAQCAGTGHFAGGMITSVLNRNPEQTLTTCVGCSWIYDAAKLTDAGKKVPLLFSMRAVPDAFKKLPSSESSYVRARKQGLPVRKVEYFVGDQRLGADDAAPSGYVREKPPAGCHAVYARWEGTDAGRT